MSQSSQQMSVVGSSTGDGYFCPSCSSWVPWGISHMCPNQYIQPYAWWWWPVTTHPSKTFKGSVKDLGDLPRDAKVGDCYYVKGWNSLLTRVQEGWLINMAEGDE